VVARCIEQGSSSKKSFSTVVYNWARELARDARALQKAARAPAARREAQRLQGEAEAALAEAGALKLQARLEDLTVWQMEKVKQSRKGSKTYSYWMASWREGGKTRNVHLGSSRKIDGEAARRKAREMKAEALGITGM
jgi:hypothetical protein